MASIVPYIVLCGVVFGNLVSSLPLQNEIESEDKKPDLFYLGERTYRNPEELGGYVEGDIIPPKGARHGVIAETARWPNGVIPYEIQGSFDQNALAVIQEAMNEFHKHTCIKFRQRTASDQDYISIINTVAGCFADLGRKGGEQIVNLSPGCTSKVGIPIHELMHSAGFLHEHTRYDRDDYVKIAFENVEEDRIIWFIKKDKSKMTTYGVPYDYESVMHYDQYAFTKNGFPTIIAKDPSKQTTIGQRIGFSDGDITKLNLMYKCKEKTLQVKL